MKLIDLSSADVRPARTIAGSLGAALILFLCQPAFSQTIPTAQPVATSAAHAQPHRTHAMFGAQPVTRSQQARSPGRGDASDPLKDFEREVALPPQTSSFAGFAGNATVITTPSSNGPVLVRQADCSLSAGNVPVSYDVSDPYSAPVSKTAHYDKLLHSEAGLTTTGGTFAAKCGDPVTGVQSNDLFYAGVSKNGMRMAAVAAYSTSADNNVLYTFIIKSDGTFGSSTTQSLPSPNNPYSIVAGDLNGDGNPDLIAVGWGGTSTQSTAITVLLGNADGTFTVGQTYNLGPGASDSAVIDDFNGDGKLDVVVAVGGVNASASSVLTFLPGKGDGTFGTAKTMSANLENVVSGDFNGDGKKDVVSGTGSIFLGNGDGTFKTAKAAFPYIESTNSTTPYLAAGDFNKDGKLDLGLSTGLTTYVLVGQGDGTFAAGNAYAGIDNHGYLMATDIDGDGNLDLYSGNAQAGVFTGDDYFGNMSYVLMGHGDGSFAGAPEVTYAAFNGLEDVNGDGKLDFVGLSGTSGNNTVHQSFGTYLGRGDGTFAAEGSLLNADVFTYSATQYQALTIDSFASGDLNGDGHPDIFYIPNQYYENTPPVAGFLTSLGSADGTFQAPTYTPVPNLATSGGQDYVGTISDVHGATNQSGKFEVVYAFSDSVYNTSNNTTTGRLGYVTQVSNGDGTLAAPVVTVAITSPAANAVLPPIVTLADLNGDKIPDMITYINEVFSVYGMVTTPSTFQVRLGNSDGSFGAALNLPVIPNPQISVSSTGVAYYPITVADVNGDGIPDVVAEGEVSTGVGTNFNFALGVGIGKGDGTFTIKSPILLGAASGYDPIGVGDFTGDGKADIAFSTFEGASGIFPGNGDGTFQSQDSGFGNNTVAPTLSLLLVPNGQQASTYDINGDGKIDLLIGGTVFLQGVSASTAPANSSATTLTASASTLAAGAKLTLTATVKASSGAGTPTGTVTFLDGTASVGTGTLSSTGVATLSTTTLAAGLHSITASYGGDADFGGSTSTAVSVTVTGGAGISASTTALTASASSAVAGTSLTFTATVTGPSGDATVPTGTVTFLDGTATLGTGALNASGVATVSTATLAVGSHSITAMYGGSAAFSGSTSAAVVVAVTAAPTGTFTASLSTASATVAAGASTTTKITITPSDGFNQAVSFSCSGLPEHATCSFSPTTVSPTSGAAVSTLTIATSVASAELAPLELDPRGGKTVVYFGAALLGLSALLRRRKQWRSRLNTLRVLSVFVILAGMASCGGSSHATPAGTSTVTVTAKATTASHTATFKLTVQ